MALYDGIGVTYSTTRRADPRIARAVRRAIGRARSLVNVGAGAGSYEPPDVPTVAVEPSRVMIDQRRDGSAPVVQARAEQLPFADGTFDVALASLTIHHWSDPAAGVAELRRVSARQVVLTWDPERVADSFWFAEEYLPETSQRERDLPTAGPIAQMLGAGTESRIVAIPADCTDGFYAAYWARPEAYLDPEVRAGISALALTDPALVDRAVRQLRRDLESGAWDRRHGQLRTMQSLDLGYRILVAGERGDEG